MVAAGGEGLPANSFASAPVEPADSDTTPEASMETDASLVSATPAPTYAEVTQQLFSETPLTQPSQPARKRGPSSPVKDSTAAKKTVDGAGAARDIFEQLENKAFISHFVHAMKRSNSVERVKLVRFLSEEEFFEVRGYYLQSQHGDSDDFDHATKGKHLTVKELHAWSKAKGMIKGDAFAKVAETAEKLRREKPTIFSG